MASLTCTTFDTYFPLWQDDLTQSGWLDLSEIDFVVPGGVLCFFFGIIETVKHWTHAVIHLPLVSEVRSYLARLGFFNLLPNHIEIEPALTQQEVDKSHMYNGQSDSVLEMTPITSRDHLNGIIERVMQTTERKLGFDKDLSRDWGLVLSEIGGNALRHSGEGQFIGVMQAFGQGKRRRIELAIGDDGQGVATSLSTNDRYDFAGRDGDAIETALADGTSRLEGIQAYSGNGLPAVRCQTIAHGGWLTVRSGEAKRCIKSKTQSEVTVASPYLAGTQVVVSLPAIQ
jgi:hypothetical protein